MVRFVFAACALLCSATPALAQVIKCVEDGKISYGSAPCTGGKDLPPVDPATAQSNTAHLKAVGDQMARERHQREAQEERERQKAAVHRRHCDRLRLRKKWSDEDAARASASQKAKAQRHARREAEVLALSCS